MCAVSVGSDLFDFSIPFVSLLIISLLSLCCSYCPTPSTSSMSWINTLRTSAEDLGTLAENEPPTVCKLQVLWMMNTRTLTCLMVLRPSASSTSVSLVVGSAGGMRRASWSAAHLGSSCSVRLFLFVACNMVGRTLVADGRCEQSDHSSKTVLTLDALTKKTVRHLHPHSIMFINSSELFFNSVLCSFLGLWVSSDFQGRRNLGMAGVLHAGTSGAHERFQ